MSEVVIDGPGYGSVIRGFSLLVLKLGAKMAKFMAKALKALKVGKVGMAAASFGSWAVLLSWQFAVMIIAMLLVHEYGHIWAMRRVGMKTKGIYLVPFVGGAAIADEAFPSRRAEAFIALMGPVFGLGFAVVMGLGYLLVPHPVLAAAAGWMATINLINLLPINPLDGGRVLKSVSLSLGSRVNFFMPLSLSCIGVGLAIVIGSGLLTFFAVIGGVEVLFDYRHRDRKPAMTMVECGRTALWASALALALLVVAVTAGDVPGTDLALKALATN